MDLNTIRLEGKLEIRRLLRSGRPARRPDHGRLVLLRSLGTVEEVAARRHRNRHRLASLADPAHAQPSQHVRLAQRQRQSSARRRRNRLHQSLEGCLDWPNPYISSASAKATTVTGPSGVKMTGPYDYVPPDYWLIDTTKYGGAFGFNTETSPGPAPPVASCLKKFLPADHLWPQDAVWNYHAGSEGFKDLTHFNSAMDAHLRRARRPRRLRAEIASYGLRRRARHVRGVHPQQIHHHRHHPVDAQ